MFHRSVISIAAACLVLSATSTLAQHQGHTMPPDTTRKAAVEQKPVAKKKSPARKASAKPKPKARTAQKAKATAAPAARAAAPPAMLQHDSAAHSGHSDSTAKASTVAPHPGMEMKPAEELIMPGMVHSGSDSAANPKMDMTHTQMDMMAGPLGISMDRMGSGTTWIPDAVRMPSRHRMAGEWEIMTHGFAFAQYDRQSGPRGDDQFGSLNWMMIMASRALAGGHFQARTMLSLDPLTVTERGYPLLLQTGESYNGEALHDRQHPHDFWMELGALYQREISSTLAWSVYAAPSGEPALGPVAFMHRPSAMDNPTAPLGHHWQDATHVSFGTVTAGIFGSRWQLEGSVFNGREPDQERWNFDPIKMDSYSGRVTLNPNRNWSFTVGSGYLKSPEAHDPDESLVRVTASAIHGRTLGAEGQVASSFVWGMNRPSHMQATHSLLAESEAILDRHNTVFGRAEFVQKTDEDLVIESAVENRFNAAALQAGYIREVVRAHWATVGIGGAATLNFVPASLKGVYGSRTPAGLFLFVRLRPYLVSPGRPATH